MRTKYIIRRQDIFGQYECFAGWITLDKPVWSKESCCVYHADKVGENVRDLLSTNPQLKLEIVPV